MVYRFLYVKRQFTAVHLYTTAFLRTCRFSLIKEPNNIVIIYHYSIIMASIIRKIIASPSAPKPVGPYNQAVLVDRTVYLSGVLGLDKETGKLVGGGAAGEARQALLNMGNILQAAGSSFDKVVKTTILLNNIDDFGAINEVYKEFFTKDYPARSTFQVGKLPLGALVEIEAIALTGKVETVICESSS